MTNTATDADIPANPLSYVLLDPPAGAVIDTNGVITWTPAEVQGPSTNVITTVVTDAGSPPLCDTKTVTVFDVTTLSIHSYPLIALCCGFCLYGLFYRYGSAGGSPPPVRLRVF